MYVFTDELYEFFDGYDNTLGVPVFIVKRSFGELPSIGVIFTLNGCRTRDRRDRLRVIFLSFSLSNRRHAASEYAQGSFYASDRSHAV